MLYQQVVKVLLKLVQAIQAKNDLTDYETCDSFDLISSIRSILHCTNATHNRCEAKVKDDMLSVSVLLDAFCHRAARLLLAVATQLEQANVVGTSPEKAWNDALVVMTRVSRAYSQFLLLRNFVQGIQGEECKEVIGPAEQAVLLDLARLFGLFWMEKELGDFLEDGYLSSEQCQWVHDCVLMLLDTVRPNAVALVDARDFSDFRLKSALGRYDGNVYRAIMEAARRDPLNETDPGPGYEEHLKRLIVGGVGTATTSLCSLAGTASRL